MGVPAAVLGSAGALAGSAGKAGSGALGSIADFFRTNKRARIIAIVVLVLLLVFLVDYQMNKGKIYSGVRIGDVDVSGMTMSEAESKVYATYNDRLSAADITIYASEQVKQEAQENQNEGDETADQISGEEEKERTKIWGTNAVELSAKVPAKTLAQEAYSVGRTGSGFLGRLGSMIFGTRIDMYTEKSDAAMESLCSAIDTAIGTPRIDCNVAIENGVATATEGQDGMMVDREKFSKEIDTLLLSEPTVERSIIAKVEEAKNRINYKDAQKVADTINNAIADGASFKYEDATWSTDRDEFGSWIKTSIEQNGNKWELKPLLNSSIAKTAILTKARSMVSGVQPHISFTVIDNVPRVQTDSAGTLPNASEALVQLEGGLFGSKDVKQQDAAKKADGNPVYIEINSMETPSDMAFEEALEYGVINEINSYTTNFSTGSGTEERNHNIRLAMDLLNNHVVAANGGSWSFNTIMGDTDEAKGFQSAGSILDGELVDSLGGGICQVATTIFNAVYEAGLPVPVRHNHTMYIASYPLGRDAAINYPDMDLEWVNDTSTDILLQTTSTEDSVTATLYGISPNRRVTSDVGEWKDGEPYTVIHKIDTDLDPSYCYVKTSGEDGGEVEVVRHTYDSNGNEIEVRTFKSVYEPKTEVVVCGSEEAWDAYLERHKDVKERIEAAQKRKNA